VRLRLERVPEEDQHVELALGDERPELLVAAERPGEQTVHRQPEPVVDELAGGPGAEELVSREGSLVEAGPVEEVLLLVVVRDERDALLDLHGGNRRLLRLGHAGVHVPD